VPIHSLGVLPAIGFVDFRLILKQEQATGSNPSREEEEEEEDEDLVAHEMLTEVLPYFHFFRAPAQLIKERQKESLLSFLTPKLFRSDSVPECVGRSRFCFTKLLNEFGWQFDIGNSV
jgi:hypothetical protein